MITPLRSLASLALLAVLVGCDNEPVATPATPAAPANPSAPAAAANYKPDYTLTLADNTVTWSAVVNTGGWTMTTDQVLVEDSMGKTSARIYITLEQPGPDEITTQALETLEDKHTADRKLDSAELSVRRKIRNQDTTGAALYSIVKTAKP